MNPRFRNIDAYIDADFACAKHLIVAASGTDNSKKTGEKIDTKGYGSGVLSLSYIATLTAAKTLSFAIEEAQSDNNSDWDAAVALQASTVVITGASGGSVDATGTSKIAINFAGKKRYLRYNITADLSHTSVDTAAFTAVVIKGGAVVKPAA